MKYSYLIHPQFPSRIMCGWRFSRLQMLPCLKYQLIWIISENIIQYSHLTLILFFIWLYSAYLPWYKEFTKVQEFRKVTLDHSIFTFGHLLFHNLQSFYRFFPFFLINRNSINEETPMLDLTNKCYHNTKNTAALNDYYVHSHPDKRLTLQSKYLIHIYKFCAIWKEMF